ncbi:MAG: hypothetical protein ABJ239_10225 [Erythrobacter sp.]
MTLRFAAARTAAQSPMARALTRTPDRAPTNDNGELFSRDEVLEAALRHFAVHGLDAASAAARNAEQALADDDKPQYAWWLEICRSFDRGQARRLERALPVASNF